MTLRIRQVVYEDITEEVWNGIETLLVAGGRYYNDRSEVDFTLRKFPGLKKIVTGGATTGADELAGQWAARKGILTDVFLPRWREHGKAAGPIRNAEMLKKSQPDAVLLFPGGAGTYDMGRRALHAGVMLLVVQPNAVV